MTRYSEAHQTINSALQLTNKFAIFKNFYWKEAKLNNFKKYCCLDKKFHRDLVTIMKMFLMC